MLVPSPHPPPSPTDAHTMTIQLQETLTAPNYLSVQVSLKEHIILRPAYLQVRGKRVLRQRQIGCLADSCAML